ncbi:hypothetical protein NDU88_001506 [Pleurodeles waltl]|uniref:Uncharacterized protein n=1 Tax=Pleurodeles waltl TaxID=8319 RepID=A0AAV7UAD8_PLEWA|nr:hypothetical protein NDU88_001506 [Pleurodeles waltl]
MEVNTVRAEHRKLAERVTINDSRRGNTGPNRAEENCRGRSDRPWASPPRNNHREERGSRALPGLAPLRRSAAHEVGAPCPEKVRRNTKAGVTDRVHPLHKITTKESRGSQALSVHSCEDVASPPAITTAQSAHTAHGGTGPRGGNLRPWRASVPL